MTTTAANPEERLRFLLYFGFRGEGQIVQDWETIREMAYEGRGGK